MTTDQTPPAVQVCAIDLLARARDIHRETCILARGDVQPSAYRCGMCEVLNAPAVPAAVEPPADRAAILREAESETACDTEAGECVHGGQPADEAQPGTEAPADVEHCVHDRAIHQHHHHTPVDGCPWCAASVEARS